MPAGNIIYNIYQIIVPGTDKARELARDRVSKTELISDGNDGICNEGIGNVGDHNKGNFNVGNYNVGDRNKGSSNRGQDNKGYDNWGNYNIGHFNIGNYNNGNDNKGSSNNGNHNKGNGNTGNYNVGNGIYGFFCTERGKGLRIFNKPTSMSFKELSERTDTLLKLIMQDVAKLPNFDKELYLKIKEAHNESI